MIFPLTYQSNVFYCVKNVVVTEHIIFYILILDGFGCPKDYFVCQNNKCLPPHYKCDGKDDCEDNSDEIEGCKGISYLFRYSKTV